MDSDLTPLLLDRSLHIRLCVAFVSLLIGGWMFGYISYLRSRRDVRRSESLAFIEECSKAINATLSPLFGQIRRRAPLADEQLDQDIMALFKFRLQVRVKSSAYLGRPQFSKTYDNIVREISLLRRHVLKLVNEESQILLPSTEPALNVQQVKAHLEELREKWGVTETDKDKLGEPYEDLIRWCSLIWHRTSKVLEEETRLALNRWV